ncbi:MAG: hypothetical protein WCN92_02890 [Eubacteriales bacterium]
METKVCKYCGETKPIDAFRLYKGVTRLSKCIACEKEDQKKYKANPKVKAPKAEKVVVKNSERTMPVHVRHDSPKPVFRTSYSIPKGDKIVIVDTTPIPNACKFSFEGGPTLYVPSGVSIFDMIKANELLNPEPEIIDNEKMEETV